MLAQNARHAAMTGQTPDRVVGRFMFDAYPKNPDHEGPDTEDVIRASVARALTSGEPDSPPMQKHDLRGQSGQFEARYWRITHSPLIRADGPPLILQVSRDVTEAVLQEKLVEAQQRAARAGADLSYFIYDAQTDRFWRSPEVDAIFGFAPGEAGGYAAPFFARMHADDLAGVQAKVAEALAEGPGAVTRIDYRIALPGGATAWVLVRGEVIADPETQAPRLVGVIMDVSDLRRNEQDLAEAVAARDLLLKEVNHRVKNSLALVISILRLEAAGVRGTSAADRLLSAAARVQAVAAVHGALYGGEDVRTVAMAPFLERLCAELAASVGADARGVTVTVEADPVELATERAVPAALVVNELVTNAFKHAFGPEGGTLSVSLCRRGADAVLTVSDDGTGTKGTLLEGASTGLGGKLISTLSRQIRAVVERPAQERGYAMRLTFPIDPSAPAQASNAASVAARS